MRPSFVGVWVMAACFAILGGCARYDASAAGDASAGDASSTPPAEAGTDGGTCANRCGATCVDLATDTAHCGRCGRACEAGSACGGGRCSPRVFARAPGAPELLQVESSSLYLRNGDAVQACALGGCDSGPRKLDIGTDARVIGTFAVFKSDLYFVGSSTAGEGIYRTYILGGGSQRIDAMPQQVLFAKSLAADSSGALFASGPYGIHRCAGSGCPRFRNAEGTLEVAVTADSLVFLNDYETAFLGTCPREQAGCTTATGLATREPGAAGFRKLRTTGDTIVFSQTVAGVSQIRSCSTKGCNFVPKTLAAMPTPIGDVAADATGAYFTTGGTLRVCRDVAAGCEKTGLETLYDGTDPLGDLTLDASYVYFVRKPRTDQAEIVRLPK